MGIIFEELNMPERKFLIKENQEIWDTYYMKNLQVWDSENKDKLGAIRWREEEKITKGKKLMAYHMPIEKITPYSYEYIRKKQSIQQYKPVILRFENYTKKSFNAASAEDIEKFRRVEKKINHFNAFMVYCVNNGIIQNTNKDFLISLLPEIYRYIGRMIAE